MAMVLRNAVIQVFILPDFNPLLRRSFRIEEGERGGIGLTFIDSHDGGSAVLAYRFTEKKQGCRCIAAGCQYQPPGKGISTNWLKRAS